MKKIILSALMLITIYGAQSQNVWKAPVMPEVSFHLNTPKVLMNQFADYVDYLKENETVIQMPDPKVIQRPEFHLFPKPIEIKKTHNKVIVVFDRKQWESFKLMQHKKWLRPSEVQKQREWLEQRKEYWNKQKNN